ncbi:hypothetical protein [Limnofasciculus baicalensis]|uniref:Uncharacterized protein n=1 Tax=Limnofasciculus baicalensis BBK-W-15 TaxID=2699891 RepID=A0AAE3KP54_9CYAN|nr:hypothetical protein [Limnofasciculus baicalensis]MCP2729343.1 hypothetical protein [Limnofasciculus baicalensis BBK-W-15]
MTVLLQNRPEAEKALSKIIAKTWLDEEFKARFLSNTNEVLAENGLTIPSDVEFSIRENTLVGMLKSVADSAEGEVVYEINLGTKLTGITDRAIHSWNTQNDSEFVGCL